jgi:flagellar M-ring protein FliF
VTVPAERLAEARLALAGGGMPRSGRIGFELFDRTNLGASDFTEQVNYQRALEGELEKTVSTLSEIDQARIHITAGKESVFLDSRQPAKATVVVKLRNQARIQQSSVTAIANLVASAVDGLSPESVSIIDDSGRLLNRPRATDADAKAAEVNLDYRQQLEAELQTKLTAALEPLLGAGKFRTGVNIDCDFTSVDQNDEIYDSTNAVMLTSQVTEESTGGGVISGGQPGTASNLPAPPAKTSTGFSGVVRRTESNSYQPSRTVRHTVNPRGAIRKISTIVLLDHAVRWEGAGAKAKKVVIPPSAEVVKAVHDVVAGIVAFNEPRGDQITVESLPFESTLDAEPPMSSTPLNQKAPAADKKQQMILLGGGALVVLILLGGALYAMRRSTKSKVTDTAPAAIAGDSQAVGLPLAPGQPGSDIEQRIREGAQEQARLEAEVLSSIKLPAATKTTEVLVRHIRENSQKDPATAANVLRAWINDTGAGKTL